MFNATVREAVTSVALRRDYEPAALLAVTETESAGVAFWTVNGRQVPAIRIEGHYFYRRLSGQKLQRAMKAGLAHKSAGVIKNPRSWAGRYEMLERMKAIDENAAIESCSWGLGQVMGAHWKSLGYKSPQHMVEVAMSGVEGQLDLMVKFIDVNGLRKFIKKRQWAKFAYRYNGPGYKKNRYHTKMAAAYRKFSNNTASPDPFVKQVQQDLAKLGFEPGPVDGLDGPSTKAAIMAFQSANGLVSDGIAGPMTLEEIERQLSAKKSATTDRAAKAGTGAAATSGVAAGVAQKATEALQEASDSLQPLVQVSDIIMWTFIIIALAGAGVALYGIFARKEA